MTAPLGMRAYRASLRANVLTVDVVIQNKGIAHSHVPEQRDMYECWVDFTGEGRSRPRCSSRLGCSASRTATSTRRAHSFTNRLINRQGATLNDLHQVWDNRVVAYNNTIHSGRSQIVRYQLHVPSDVYRPDHPYGHRELPPLRSALHGLRHGDEALRCSRSSRWPRATRTFALGDNPAGRCPTSSDNTEWMRWNNYGIGLLDAQQYAASVQRLRACREAAARLRRRITPTSPSPTFSGSAMTMRGQS